MSAFPTALLKGYSEFKNGKLSSEKARYRELAEQGQAPETLVIACCDSRAAPETNRRDKNLPPTLSQDVSIAMGSMARNRKVGGCVK